MLQFWLSQNIFGDIGLKPNKESKAKAEALIPIKEILFSHTISSNCFYFSFVMVTDLLQNIRW
jgi:hypothetical protein